MLAAGRDWVPPERVTFCSFIEVGQHGVRRELTANLSFMVYVS